MNQIVNRFRNNQTRKKQHLRRLLPREASASLATVASASVAAAAETTGCRTRLLVVVLAAGGFENALETRRREAEALAAVGLLEAEAVVLARLRNFPAPVS